MAVMSDRTQTFFLSNSSTSLPARKHSAPIGPYQPPIASATHDYLYGRGSLLPMPPNYNEGSCWTLASVKCLNLSPTETRPRTISVQVTKVSLRMDGRWAEEKPYIIQKTWDEWIDFREQLISQYPEVESILPKLSKGQGFLESIFTNSKRSHNTQTSNMKELNGFLTCLVGNCPKKVLNSNILYSFLQTEQMRVGAHHVEYTVDDLPLRRAPLAADFPNHEEGTSIASHLQAFRFPGPKPAPSHVSSHLKTQASQPNLSSWREVPSFEVDNRITNEKVVPHDRRRPTLDTMVAIAERPPPRGSIPDLQSGHVLRSGTMGRTLATPTARLVKQSKKPPRPTTGLTRPPPLASTKRPTTSDSRLPQTAMMKPAMAVNSRAACNLVPPTPARRPSEIPLSYSQEAEVSQARRPRLREFKSMQDIRATPINAKTEGRSGRGGLVDPTRNNSVPAAGEPSWMVFELRSPTNAWHKHRRTPSDSSSSFGSSQLSPISSVESSPTVTPSTSDSSIPKQILAQQIQPELPCLLSVDSLGLSSTKCDSSSSTTTVVPEREPSKMIVRPHIPPIPFYPIPPRITNSTTNPAKGKKSSSTLPQSQKRPHTSAGNGNGQKPNTLTLKVVHSESKTNIILAVQKGLFSLPQIKSKIQNKLRMAAEIELDPNWKIRLTRIDQEQFAMYSETGDGKEIEQSEDDGSKLLQLINGKSTDPEIKKITLRIY
ncbi:hypothetical protein MJO28_014967 [Puccinia striiformis f. sp. tritici]|uniref:Uncharacterized protein n=1 Tax=Puccinia striiformis f. sp. tritici TaxID=168172 RepID=A0ACC0DRD9_9BASI|nr:hypothetical protein MJO28_014967 [Puccinia striiformis f. sp. tritici]